MLSKNKIKLISSLSHKKNRDELSLFIAEGSKTLTDIARYYPIEILCGTFDWMETHQEVKANEKIEVTESELKKISLLKTPQKVLAVFKQIPMAYRTENIVNQLSLALDGIQDPGNLGTIIRIADWFGIKDIFCSANTCDIYNPKTVQATMGAIGRVRIHYVDLQQFIGEVGKSFPVFGAFLNGANIYSEKLPANGLIVMGNEGNGITDEITQLVKNKLFIPNFPLGEKTSESLNVATATAIVCSEFRRRAI